MLLMCVCILDLAALIIMYVCLFVFVVKYYPYPIVLLHLLVLTYDCIISMHSYTPITPILLTDFLFAANDLALTKPCASMYRPLIQGSKNPGIKP